MTVHMLRVATSRPGNVTLEQARTAVRDWLTRHQWLDHPDDFQLQEAAGDDPETLTWWVGDFRFELDEDRGSILSDAENTLQGLVDWYRLAYHGCDHDQPGVGCSWNETREFGPVPQEVDL